jgi:hypothetical protein
MKTARAPQAIALHVGTAPDTAFNIDFDLVTHRIDYLP